MDTQITITIWERDGKLTVGASVPNGAENTVAGALADLLMRHAQEAMNTVTGADSGFAKSAQH